MAKFIVEGSRPLNGKVTVAGNKNEALPALMACLLTDKPIILKRVPVIGDVLTICDILKNLGVSVEWIGEDTLRLEAKEVTHSDIPPELSKRVRASIMFIGPMLARLGKITLPPPGGDVIGARRVDSHFEGLTALGATIQFGPPIVAEAKKLSASEIFLDEPSVTATENIILAAVLAEGVTSIYNAACEPHVEGLCSLLNGMGAKIEGLGSNHLKITGVSALHGTEHRIGPDFMEVGSFLCLGAIAGGKVTVQDIVAKDLRYIMKTLNRLGIEPHFAQNDVTIDSSTPMKIKADVSGRIPTIYSAPWPGYPTDLMSVAIVAATQAQGTVIFFEKMYEGRMFFTDNLMSMGANIVLCDPHRIVITGPEKLVGTKMSSPDVRAGMALLMAALISKGKSEINNIVQIERGYSKIDQKLLQLGAALRRED